MVSLPADNARGAENSGDCCRHFHPVFRRQLKKVDRPAGAASNSSISSRHANQPAKADGRVNFFFGLFADFIWFWPCWRHTTFAAFAVGFSCPFPCLSPPHFAVFHLLSAPHLASAFLSPAAGALRSVLASASMKPFSSDCDWNGLPSAAWAIPALSRPAVKDADTRVSGLPCCESPFRVVERCYKTRCDNDACRQQLVYTRRIAFTMHLLATSSVAFADSYNNSENCFRFRRRADSGDVDSCAGSARSGG